MCDTFKASHASGFANLFQADDCASVKIFDANKSKFLDKFCYEIHASYISNEFSPRVVNWLTTDMSIEKFNSAIPFPLASAWDKGITKLNVQGLRQLGLNEFRCRALQWGFDLGLTALPPFQSAPPDNYSSLEGYGDKVLEKLMKDAQKGILELFEPTSSQAYWFHPLGAVPKGDTDCRIVVDTSATGLNNIIQDTSMSLPSLHSILNSIKKGWVACTYDLTSGFYQLPLRADMANFVCIRLPNGKHGRFRFICFGLKCAPFIFQGTMMDIRNLLIKNGIISCAILVYIDDFLLAAESRHILESNRNDFEKFMEWAGLLLNPDKKSEISTRVTVIGYEIDTIELWVSIAHEKFLKRKGLLDQLIIDRSCTWSTFQKIAGKLNHMAAVTIGGRFYMHPWWVIMKRTLATWQLRHGAQSQPNANITINLHDNDILESMLWWQNILSKDSAPRRNILERVDGFLDIYTPEFFYYQGEPLGFAAERVLNYVRKGSICMITSDASAAGGGWFYDNQTEGYSYIWSPATAFASSNFRELLTIELALKHAKIQSSVQGFWVRSDNTPSVGSLNKLRSDSLNLCSIISRIAQFLIAQKREIAATHIPGKENVIADALSRMYIAVWDSLSIRNTKGFAWFIHLLKNDWGKKIGNRFVCLQFSDLKQTDQKLLAKAIKSWLVSQEPEDNVKKFALICPHPVYAVTMINALLQSTTSNVVPIVLIPNHGHQLYPSQQGPLVTALKKAKYTLLRSSPRMHWYSGKLSTESDFTCKLNMNLHIIKDIDVQITRQMVQMWAIMDVWVHSSYTA